MAMLAGKYRIESLVLPGLSQFLSTQAILAFIAFISRGSGADIVLTFALSAALIVSIVCGGDGWLKRFCAIN